MKYNHFSIIRAGVKASSHVEQEDNANENIVPNSRDLASTSVTLLDPDLDIG